MIQSIHRSTARVWNEIYLFIGNWCRKNPSDPGQPSPWGGKYPKGSPWERLYHGRKDTNKFRSRNQVCQSNCSSFIVTIIRAQAFLKFSCLVEFPVATRGTFRGALTIKYVRTVARAATQVRFRLVRTTGDALSDDANKNNNDYLNSYSTSGMSSKQLQAGVWRARTSSVHRVK